MGFMVTFVIGGMTGVLLAVPPADFALHNSLSPKEFEVLRHFVRGESMMQEMCIRDSPGPGRVAAGAGRLQRQQRR